MGKWERLTGRSSPTGDEVNVSLHAHAGTHPTHALSSAGSEPSVVRSVSSLSPVHCGGLELVLHGSGSEATGQSGPLPWGLCGSWEPKNHQGEAASSAP